MRSRQYRAIEVGKDAVVTLQPAGFGLRSSFHRSHVLQRSGGDVLITRLDSLPASQKENTLLTDSVSFVTGCRFCCPHPYTSQGRGSVRGEPLTGSPTRVQSSARRRPLLHSKSAAPKKKRHTNVCLFFFGAGDEARTRYLDLGKVALYQMSYARKWCLRSELNQRHADFQSAALPTELQRRMLIKWWEQLDSNQ